MPEPLFNESEGTGLPPADGPSSLSPILRPEADGAVDDDDGLELRSDWSSSPEDGPPSLSPLLDSERNSPGTADEDDGPTLDSSGGGSVDEAAPGSTFPVDALPLADGPSSLSPMLNAEDGPSSALQGGRGGDPADSVALRSASDGGTGSTAVSTASWSSKTGSPAPLNGLREGAASRRPRGPTRLREIEGEEGDEPAPRLDLGLPDGADAGLAVTFPMLERISSFERGSDYPDPGRGDDGGLDGMLTLMGGTDAASPLSSGPDAAFAFDTAEAPLDSFLSPSPLRLPSASGSPAFRSATDPSPPSDSRVRPAARSVYTSPGIDDDGYRDLPFQGSEGQGDGVFLDGTDVSRPSSSLCSAGSSPTLGGGGGLGPRHDELAERLGQLSLV